MLGESPAQQRARIEEASKNANDLTGLVKHKKRSKDDAPSTDTAVNGSSKRKANAIDEDGGSTEKKAKVEDAIEKE